MPRDASTPVGRRYGQLKHLPMPPALHDYLLRCHTAPDPVTASQLQRTAGLGDAAAMAIPAEQVALLTMLTLWGSRTRSGL